MHEPMFVKNDKRRDGPLLGLHDPDAADLRSRTRSPGTTSTIRRPSVVCLRRGYTSADAIQRRSVRWPRTHAAARVRHRVGGFVLRRSAKRGNEAIYIFLVVLASSPIMVLAAQYESFILPLAVLLLASGW